jgi:hypothetical protein
MQNKLYQINTRVLLTHLSRELGKAASLSDIPDVMLDHWSSMGMNWIWMLGIWQTGPASCEVSRTNADWLREYHETLPDLTTDDIGGSMFAIQDYRVHDAFGGREGLKSFRDRLSKRGLKLMLDFVPNHVALDHQWLKSNPDYFIEGTAEQLASQPANYVELAIDGAKRIYAHGRDPYFPGWPDTVQLDYGNPKLQSAMKDVLVDIATQCDGVRCDMAMLILPDIFEHTWSRPCADFWKDAIPAAKKANRDFELMAEVYWQRERDVLDRGFDFAYDKDLYDKLRKEPARVINQHLDVDPSYQSKLARFLENHDEARAAKVFDANKHQAAAIVSYFASGLKFFHQGQFEGKQVRITPHLVRGPDEPVNAQLSDFYRKLLELLKKPAVMNGTLKHLVAKEAWSGNWTAEDFIVYQWSATGQPTMLIAVNYSSHRSQCYVPIENVQLTEPRCKFTNLWQGNSWERDTHAVQQQGYYFDLAEWEFVILEME